MPFDILDLLAVIAAVWHTVRKLDIMKRQPQDYPHVAADDFTAWRESERAAYALGSWASFLKLALDPALWLAAPSLGLAGSLLRTLAAVIDVSWAVAVIVATLRAGRARRRRDELGILLHEPPQPSD